MVGFLTAGRIWKYVIQDLTTKYIVGATMVNNNMSSLAFFCLARHLGSRLLILVDTELHM